MQQDERVLHPSNPIVNSFLRSLIRYPLFKLTGFYKGRKINQELSKLRSFYNANLEYQNNLSKKYLIKTLINAKKSKFYKEKISDEIISKVSKDINYLTDIPITDKSDLLNYPNDFFTRDFLKDDLIKASTNGSTGPCAILFYDNPASDASSAITWYCRSFYEKFYNNSTLHFAADLNFNSKPFPSYIDWLKFFATNRFNIFVGDLDNSSNKKYFEEILKKKFQLIHSHPSTIYHLALYAKDKEIKAKNIFKVFESSGEKLFEYQKKIIKSVFNCKIVDRYGFAESGIVAYQLPFYEPYLTIMRHHCFIENSFSTNEDLVITNFNNSIFPLIRYKNGDKVLTENQTIPRYIKEVKGREHSVHKYGKTKLNTSFIMDILNHSLSGILDFQISHGENPKLYILLSNDSNLTSQDVKVKMHELTAVKFEVMILKANEFKKLGLRNKFSHIL